MPFALLTDPTTLQWLDVGVLAGAFVVYLALGFIFPGLVLRPLFWVVTRTIYRIRAVGAENVPATGPVLCLSNHVTYIDWLLVWAVCPRKVRFVAWAGWTKNWLFRWFLRVYELDPDHGHGGPRQLVKSLKQITAALDAGECVCLFPEGSCAAAGHAAVPPRLRTHPEGGETAGPGRAVVSQPALGEHLQLLRRPGADEVAGADSLSCRDRVRETAAVDGHGDRGPAGDPGPVGRPVHPGERQPSAGPPTVSPDRGPVHEDATGRLGRCLGRQAARDQLPEGPRRVDVHGPVAQAADRDREERRYLAPDQRR